MCCEQPFLFHLRLAPMVGEGPFLWLSKDAPPAGFRDVPPGGMCLSAFLFVRQGHTILLGKYRDDPRWETLAGLDDHIVNSSVAGKGWTMTPPPWYADLAWRDPKTTPASEYARGHEDVVARWLEPRPGH